MKLSLDDRVAAQLQKIESIPLNKTNKVKLMKRVDTKYVFCSSLLPSVLEKLSSAYYILCIDGVNKQHYKTVYFDSDNYHFYLQHHNKIRSRYKVRFRTYTNSGLSFLEVKHKTNRQETIKNRIPQSHIPLQLNAEHSEFITGKIGEHEQNLSPSLENSFQRITLISKKFNERITIDNHLCFYDTRNRKEHKSNRLCIVETKRDFHNPNTSSARIMQELRIKPSGFSKYCMGLALTNAHIKKNLFKPRLIKFQSILN